MQAVSQERAETTQCFAIALHGGAGQSPKEDTAAAVEASLAKALDIGVAVLTKDGTSLDAVEQVIRYGGRSAVQRRPRGGVQQRRPA